VLAEGTPDLLPSITRYLGDHERSVRGAAVTLLRKTGGQAADAVAMELIATDFHARCNAALVLGDIGGTRHLALLEKLRADDAHERVRQFANNAFVRLKSHLR
jgi:HEAT repeat protein